MPYLGESQIPAMFKHCANATVVCGGVTLRCVVDRVDEEMLRGEYAHLIGKAITVSCPTGALPALAIGVALTVDGVAFKAVAPMQRGDGGVTTFLCAVN